MQGGYVTRAIYYSKQILIRINNSIDLNMYIDSCFTFTTYHIYPKKVAIYMDIFMVLLLSFV